MALVGPRPAPPAGTARFVMSGTILGNYFANVFWLRLTSAGGPNAGDLTAVLTTIKNAWDTWVMPHLSSDCVYSEIDGVWTPTVGTEVVVAHADSQAGGGGAAVQEAAACAVASWKIGAYYRGGHPRSYIPGLQPAQIVTGNHHLEAFRAQLQNDLLSWLGAVNLATSGDITDTELGTVSFQSDNVWRDPPIFRPYTSVAVRSILGTQRRRLIG